MNIPAIIYQTSTRWLVVYKPIGWSLGKRGSGASVQAFLGPLLSRESSIYFPFELDSRIAGLGVVCTDRGMQSQFERFKIRSELEFRYSILIKSGSRDSSFPPNYSVEYSETESLSPLLMVRAPQIIPVRRLGEFMKSEIEAENVRLYSISFPDPLKPVHDELSISIAPVPPEGWGP